jgi:hypothetical protein
MCLECSAGDFQFAFQIIVMGRSGELVLDGKWPCVLVTNLHGDQCIQRCRIKVCEYSRN